MKCIHCMNNKAKLYQGEYYCKYHLERRKMKDWKQMTVCSFIEQPKGLILKHWKESEQQLKEENPSLFNAFLKNIERKENHV